MKRIDLLGERHNSGVNISLIPIDLDRTCHILCVGASGSGKTMASMLFSAKCSKIPSSKEWILDYKGDDSFKFLRGVDGARYYQYADCLAGMEDYYAMFQARLAGDPDRSFRLLWVDEYASMILNLPKKEAESAKTMLATILMMGRSMGCQVMISVQRASAEIFAGSRDNLGVCLALGTLSKESAAMLGFDRDAFLPMNTIGGGHLLINGEQKPVQVPFVGPRGLAQMKIDIMRAVTR